MVLHYEKIFFFCHKKKATLKCDLPLESTRRSDILPSYAEAESGEDDFESIGEAYPKTEDEEALIRSAIKNNEFLSQVLYDKRTLDTFVSCMYKENLKENQIIIEKGEKGTHLYISITGSYKVILDEENSFIFDDVRVFGELAVLYSATRLATVEAIENGSVWVLDCPTYKRLTVKSAMKQQDETISFLMKIPNLNRISKEKLYQVANLLKSEFFKPSEEIVTQCEIGDKFYIIRAGTVTVEKDHEVVAKLTRGQYFGELALLTEEFRQATVIADSPGVECLSLNRKDFIDHFGEIEDFTKLKNEPILQKEKSYEFLNFEKDDFDCIRVIGKGAYGEVKLVQHKTQKSLVFVMKYMKKAYITTKSHQEHVFCEKNLQMSCNSPFLIKMHGTFKDSRYLYFLLEACLGGDLWNLLHKQKRKCFEEDRAKFYSACVLKGLHYLHDHGIIYRDLKPENIVVHNSGYLKLADFGFVKKMDAKEKTFTFVGTAEYVAPEIIRSLGYNKSVDYWAFGILIFELLVGQTPFKVKHDPQHIKTYEYILKGIDVVTFPAIVPKKAKMLIRKLCRTFPSERLGCQKRGVKAIMEHPWYENFDWEKLRSLEMEAPDRPILSNNTDTRHFDKFNTDFGDSPEDFSDWDRSF